MVYPLNPNKYTTLTKGVNQKLVSKCDYKASVSLLFF